MVAPVDGEPRPPGRARHPFAGGIDDAPGRAAPSRGDVAGEGRVTSQVEELGGSRPVFYRCADLTG